MNKATKHKLALAAKLLEEASDEFGNHSCNDYQLENTDENWKLICEAEQWNNPRQKDMEPRPPLNKKIDTADFFIMSYLAHFLKEQSK